MPTISTMMLSNLFIEIKIVVDDDDEYG